MSFSSWPWMPWYKRQARLGHICSLRRRNISPKLLFNMDNVLLENQHSTRDQDRETSSISLVLRDYMFAWYSSLLDIRDPHSYFDEACTAIRDRSRLRLEQFSTDPRQEEIPQLQQAILEDGAEMRELEVNYASSKDADDEIYRSTLELLARRIIDDVGTAFGVDPGNVATGIPSSLSEAFDTQQPIAHDDFESLAQSEQPEIAYHNTRLRAKANRSYQSTHKR